MRLYIYYARGDEVCMLCMLVVMCCTVLCCAVWVCMDDAGYGDVVVVIYYE
jgi:hypothetical protein